MFRQKLLFLFVVFIFPSTFTFGQDAPKTPPPQSPDQIVRPVETKEIPSTTRRILTNFWHDEKAIFTSPLHINRDNAKWWGLFGAGTAAFIATDRRTSGALPNTAGQVKVSKHFSKIGADYTTLPIAGGLYVVGRITDNPKARETGVLGAEALLDSYMTVAVLKLIAGRERPEYAEGRGRFFKGHHGFPSGHAIMSWSFASLISHEYQAGKVIPTTMYGLATIASVSRFSARKHFASDILAGGAMGWFIGKYVFEHHLDPSIHKRYNPNAQNRLIPEVNPLFDPRSHSYGVALAWK